MVQWEKFQDVGMTTRDLVGEALHLSLQNHYVMGQVETIKLCECLVFLLVCPQQVVVENAEVYGMKLVLVAESWNNHVFQHVYAVEGHWTS